MQESWAVFSVLRPGGCFSTDKFYATVQGLPFEIQSGCQWISHEHQINTLFCFFVRVRVSQTHVHIYGEF